MPLKVVSSSRKRKLSVSSTGRVSPNSKRRKLSNVKSATNISKHKRKKSNKNKIKQANKNKIKKANTNSIKKESNNNNTSNNSESQSHDLDLDGQQMDLDVPEQIDLDVAEQIDQLEIEINNQIQVESQPNIDSKIDPITAISTVLQHLNLEYNPSSQFPRYHDQILKTKNNLFIMSRNRTNTTLIIPDYNYKEQRIKYASYRHVTKYESGWVCNCDNFILKNDRQYCDHTLLAILFSNENPTKLPLYDYKPESEFTLERDDGATVMMIDQPSLGRKMVIYSVANIDNRYAFVHINKGFKNIVCSNHRGSRTCVHRRLLLDSIGEKAKEYIIDESNKASEDTVYWDEDQGFADWDSLASKSKPISFQTIPVPKIYRTKYDDTPDQDIYYAATKPRNIPYRLIPNVTKCDCGQELLDCHSFLKQKDALLFDNATNYYIDVYNFQCPACHKEHVYDGLHDKIMNHDNKVLVYHDVFVQFQIIRNTSRCPLNSFITAHLALYQGNNSITSFFNAPMFSRLYQQFTSLQGYTNKLFCRGCHEKGVLPRKLMCDATSLLMQKKYIKGTVSPKDTVKFNQVKVKMKNKLKTVRVVYIKDAQLRERLKDYLIVKKLRIHKKDKQNLKDKSTAALRKFQKKLYADLRKKKHHKLVNMLKYMDEHMSEMDPQLVKTIGSILGSLASYIPFIRIVPYQITALLKDHYSNDNWIQIKEEVVKYQPLFYAIHEQFTRNGGVPEEWFSLIKEVAMLSSEYVSKLELIRGESPSIPAAEPKHQSVFDNSVVSGTCYGYEVHHTRPTYDLDQQSKKENAPNLIDEEDQYVGECNKYYHEFNSMSNGIVTFKCMDHGEMTGCHVMREPEGLNDYFSLMIMKYPGNTAPEVVLCDNACQLQRYCMHREPSKFKNTLFLNDEMHATGHKCGLIYSVKPYKDNVSEFSFLNDPSIEQTNRILKYLKISTMYMHLKTFMSFVTNMLEIESRKAILKRSTND